MRALLYQIASISFAPPSQFLVDDLGNGSFITALCEINKRYNLSLAQNEKTIENQLLASEPTLLADLQAEYVRLFVSSVGALPAPPYGSYYLDSVLFGPHFKNVMDAYTSSGFKLNSDYDDLPDHVSAEFEFLWYLSHQQENASIEKSFNFLEQHLLGWLPDFTAAVKGAAQHPFYRTMASWTSQAVAADAAWLRQHLGKTNAKTLQT